MDTDMELYYQNVVRKFNAGQNIFRRITVEILLRKIDELTAANASIANLNATLIEFVTEVNYKPYSDSDYLSLLESLRTRAAVVLQDITAPNNASTRTGWDDLAETELSNDEMDPFFDII